MTAKQARRSGAYARGAVVGLQRDTQRGQLRRLAVQLLARAAEQRRHVARLQRRGADVLRSVARGEHYGSILQARTCRLAGGGL